MSVCTELSYVTRRQMLPLSSSRSFIAAFSKYRRLLHPLMKYSLLQARFGSYYLLQDQQRSARCRVLPGGLLLGDSKAAKAASASVRGWAGCWATQHPRGTSHAPKPGQGCCVCWAPGWITACAGSREEGGNVKAHRN